MSLKTAVVRLAPLSGDPPVPPSDAEVQRPGRTKVTIPDGLGIRWPGAEGVAWYRFEVPKQRSGNCGLLLRHADVNAVVYVNGEWLGQGGPFAPPPELRWNRPLYFAFPSSRLANELNTIDVGVLVNGSLFNALDEITLGPHAALYAEHQHMLMWHSELAQASTVLSLVIAFLFAVLGFSLRDSKHLLLSLAAACHAFNSLNFHLRQPLFDYWLFTSLTNVAIDLMAITMGALMLRLLGLQRRWLDRAMLFGALALTLGALLVPGAALERCMPLVHTPVAILYFVLLGLFIRYRARLPQIERQIYIATAIATWIIGMRDFIFQLRRHLDPTNADIRYLFPLLGPVILVGFGAALLVRFLQMYHRVERANLELTQQVEQKRAELESNFTRMREIEHQALLLEERERLMEEMHDGMGGHLVAAVAMLERGRYSATDISRALREALDDMRLVIQSLQPASADLSLMLAEMRERLEPRLTNAGLRFHWAVGDLPSLALGPAEVLQVMRIVQESITNVLKHARARQITVVTGVTRGMRQIAFIEISDDGHGIEAARSEGRGLPSMRARAQRIGGELSVTSSLAGTAVRLSIRALAEGTTNLSQPQMVESHDHGTRHLTTNE
jgi:signal transduction histidine kinase